MLYYKINTFKKIKKCHDIIPETSRRVNKVLAISVTLTCSFPITGKTRLYKIYRMHTE